MLICVRGARRRAPRSAPSRHRRRSTRSSRTRDAFIRAGELPTEPSPSSRDRHCAGRAPAHPDTRICWTCQRAQAGTAVVVVAARCVRGLADAAERPRAHAHGWRRSSGAAARVSTRPTCTCTICTDCFAGESDEQLRAARRWCRSDPPCHVSVRGRGVALFAVGAPRAAWAGGRHRGVYQAAADVAVFVHRATTRRTVIRVARSVSPQK